MVLRTCVVLNLILGILFWTGNAADSLVLVHMGLGILVVLSLWTLGLAQALTKGGSWGLAIGAVVLGIILAASGGTQDEILTGSLHWVIQVIHLLLGLSGRDQSKKWARTLFWYSNMYLAALFAIMVLDRVIH